MIDELAKLVPSFPGKPNHTRCFLHILSLVAKTVIKLFDVPKKKKTADGEMDDEEGSILSSSEELLERLAEGIEIEERDVRAGLDDDEDAEDDNDEGWRDEVELLSEEERAEFDRKIIPVRLVIVKVSEFNCLQIMTTHHDSVAESGIQDRQLVNATPTHLENDTQELGIAGAPTAKGCDHEMEFDIRYVGLCGRPS
jgi:hypothetical protein